MKERAGEVSVRLTAMAWSQARKNLAVESPGIENGGDEDGVVVAAL